MNKKLLLGLFLGIVIVFLGFYRFFLWANVEKVDSLKISFSSGALPPEYYFEGYMSFVPDYELRSLAVSYFIDQPYLSEKISEPSVVEGSLGGEFFDRFEGLVDFMFEENVSEMLNECVGGHVLSIDMTYNSSNIISRSLSVCGDLDADVLFVETFYLDVKDMFTQDAY